MTTTNFDFETVAEAQNALIDLCGTGTKESQRERERLYREARIRERDEEGDHCRECGNTPETGACFYCKMD